MYLWPCLLVPSFSLGCGTEAPTQDAPAKPPARRVTPQHADSVVAAERRRDRRSSYFPGVPVSRGTLADGRRVQLRVFQDDGGPCLVLEGVDRDLRGCGRVPLEREPPLRRPVVAEATVGRKGNDRDEVFAATSARVAQVLVYVGDAEIPSKLTLLLQVRDNRTLSEAGVHTGPFGYFFAEVPRSNARIRAVALDADGNKIGSAGFWRLQGMGDRFVLTKRRS